jgi:DNA-binding protein HU-beta
MIDIKKQWTGVTDRQQWSARGASFVAKVKATKLVWFPPQPVETGQKAAATAKKATKRTATRTSRSAKKTTGTAKKAAGAKTKGATKKSSRGAKKVTGAVGRQRA